MQERNEDALHNAQRGWQPDSGRILHQGWWDTMLAEQGQPRQY